VIDEITLRLFRYWLRESFERALREGGNPTALDKEYVRRWLLDQGYRGEGPAPPLPDEVRCEAARRYIEAYERVTGLAFAPGPRARRGAPCAQPATLRGLKRARARCRRRRLHRLAYREAAARGRPRGRDLRRSLARSSRSGRDLGLPLVTADLADRQTLLASLREHRIDTVMHFAAYAYVGESTESPLLYYDNNVATTVGVLRCMQEAGVRRFVFSSTCATYGSPERVPITEDAPQRPVSPTLEQADGRADLRDHLVSDPSFSFAALRYFNACGCAMDGSLGEDHDPETHLIPSVLQAILGQRDELVVFGTDYPTPDGTNVRDYIHVDDSQTLTSLP